MPGTFSQIYIQVVFAVHGRQNLIRKAWKDELHKYMAGIIKGKEQRRKKISLGYASEKSYIKTVAANGGTPASLQCASEADHETRSLMIRSYGIVGMDDLKNPRKPCADTSGCD